MVTVRSRFDDPDMWWHLKTGQIIWTTRAIPTTDIFSYTTNHHAWVPHEWIAQVLIFLAYRLASNSGLMLWLCFFTAAILITGHGLCSQYSGDMKIGWIGALVIWFCSTSGLAIRPQMIGYLLLVVELLLLQLGSTRNPRWFFFLPPLFALWVNCHGSFFLGVLIGCTLCLCSFFSFRIGPLVSSRWEPRSSRQLAIALGLSVAALWLNPVGLKQVLYPLDTFLRQPIVLSRVEEWRPLLLTSPRGLGLLAILGSICLVLIVRRPPLYLSELVLLAMGTELAISHRRMMFVFGILAAPILSRLLSSWLGSYESGLYHPIVNGALISASVLAVYLAFPNQQELQRQIDAKSPVRAVEYMRAHQVSGRMLNDFAYGGYLIWAAPQYPVFVDGRADVFDWTGVLGEFGRWATLRSDPNVLLNKYGVGFCLLDRNSPMAHVLPVMQGWRSIYSDEESVIFERTSVASRADQRVTRGDQ